MISKEQIDKCFDQPGESGIGKSRYDIARAIEAECAKVPEGLNDLFEEIKKADAALSKGDTAQALVGLRIIHSLMGMMLSHVNNHTVFAAAPQPAPKAEQQKPVAYISTNQITGKPYLVWVPVTSLHGDTLYETVPLYRTPPDLVTENERLQSRVKGIEAFWAGLCNDKDKRIAELEAENTRLLSLTVGSGS